MKYVAGVALIFLGLGLGVLAIFSANYCQFEGPTLHKGFGVIGGTLLVLKGVNKVKQV